MEGLDYIAQRLSATTANDDEPIKHNYADGFEVTLKKPDYSVTRVFQRDEGLFDIFSMAFSYEQRNDSTGYSLNLTIEEGAMLSQKEIDGILKSAQFLSNIPSDANDLVRDLSEIFFSELYEIEDVYGNAYTKMSPGKKGHFNLRTMGTGRSCLFTLTNGKTTYVDLCADTCKEGKEWQSISSFEQDLTSEYFHKVYGLAIEALR